MLLLGEKFLWGKYLERLPGLIRWACAMLAVILSWVLFRAADLEQALAYLGAMFSQTTGLAQDGQAVYYLLQFWPEWILALIAFLPVKQWLQSWAGGPGGRRSDARPVGAPGIGPGAAGPLLWAAGHRLLQSLHLFPF